VFLLDATHRYGMAENDRPYPNGIIVEQVDVRPTFGAVSRSTIGYLADFFVRVEDARPARRTEAGRRRAAS
jgi:hypothetical protein